MKKTKKHENKINKTMSKLRNILDKNYFHVCIEVKNNSRIIEWCVYYSNLPSNLYWSDKNKPLLTSEKNTISDIYTLKDKFESEKKKEINSNLPDYIKISSDVYNAMLNIKWRAVKSITDLMLISCVINIVNAIFIRNLAFSLLSLFLILCGAILNVVAQKQIDVEIHKAQEKVQEAYIKEKIRLKGLYFVERLRNEF